MPSRTDLARGGGDEDLGVAEADDDGAVGVAGELAGLEGQGLVGSPATGPETVMASAMDALLWPRGAPRGSVRCASGGQFPVVDLPSLRRGGSATGD